MPATTDVITTHRECPADSLPAVTYTSVQPLLHMAARVYGGVQGAQDIGLAPSPRVLADAAALSQAILDATAPGREVTASCGWSGDATLVRDTGAEYRWTCPRCGTEHDETVERGQA